MTTFPNNERHEGEKLKNVKRIHDGALFIRPRPLKFFC